MARDRSPKYKQSRREGIELHPGLDKTGTAKSPLTRKSYPPGSHGQKLAFSKLTNYGKQLREKQKAKRIYGILERQFSNYYKKAIHQTGDTGSVMLGLLEQRLDNVVYRLGLAKTRPAARQMVTHGHILLNGKKVTIPSVNVKTGDSITIKEKTAESAAYKALAQTLGEKVPGWLVAEKNGGRMVSEPDIEEPKTIIDIRQIVEYYSR